MGERVVSALSALSMIALLAACQQAPTKITHKEPGSMLVQYPAPDGKSTNLSYFPRWNNGSIEMAQGDKSGPVKGAYAGATAGTAPSSNATLPVNYASVGGAGSEASKYYNSNPMGAARVGGAQPIAAPAPVAMASAAPVRSSGMTAQTAPAGSGAHAYAPIPLQASPFGKASAPLEPEVAALVPTKAVPSAPTQMQLAQANANAGVAPSLPAGSLYAPSAPDARPKPSVAQDGSTTSQFAAMLAGEPLARPVSASASDYAGSIPLGGAAMAAAPAPHMASAQPANMAAPSLPLASTEAEVPATSTVRQATAAPVASGTIHQSGQVDNFVIHAKSDSVVHDDEEDDEELVDASKASPVKPVSETTMAGSADLKWPVQGSIISKFGPKAGGKSNDGVNIAAPAGTPIKAVADGMVIYAGNELQGYGNMLVVSHDAGRASVYAHAAQLKVRKGQFVKQGQVIATVGQTGGVSQPQLHFAVREGSTPVDPMPLLQSKVASK